MALAYFTANLRELAGAPAYDAAMLTWLVDNFELLGLPVQNWMLVVGGVIALYFAMLAIGRRGQRIF